MSEPETTSETETDESPVEETAEEAEERVAAQHEPLPAADQTETAETADDASA